MKTVHHHPVARAILFLVGFGHACIGGFFLATLIQQTMADKLCAWSFVMAALCGMSMKQGALAFSFACVSSHEEKHE